MEKEKDEDKILRTQSIRIKKGHKLYNYCASMCFLSKNLYNTSNFYVRQVFSGLKKDTSDRQENEIKVIEEINSSIPKLNNIKITNVKKKREKELKKPIEKQQHIAEAKLYEPLTVESSYPSYELLDGVFKISDQIDYRELPSHSNQHVMKLVFQDWKSFFEANKDYKKNPSKYKGKPKPPRYANKNGRKIAFFSNQTCVIQDEKYLKLPKTKEKLNIGKLGQIDGRLKQVRIVPGPTYYTVEIIFELNEEQKSSKESPDRILGIDLGIDNFATIVNNVGLEPIIVKGKVLKSINQYYNKMRAHYYAILRKGKTEKQGAFTSKRLQRLDIKRGDKLKDFLHKASYSIVQYAAGLNIDTIIIGKNEGFKDNIKLRRDVKLNFTGIPYSLFTQILTYKANMQGIKVIITEESYTSKASFLDSDEIPSFGKKKDEKFQFSGRRVERGMYKTKNGILINADVNGAANIIRKVVPDAFSKGNRGVVSTPLVLIVA